MATQGSQAAPSGRIRLYLADPNGMGLPPAGESRCTVIGEAGPCDILDVTVLRRALATPSLPPGLRPVCEGANEQQSYAAVRIGSESTATPI